MFISSFSRDIIYDLIKQGPKQMAKELEDIWFYKENFNTSFVKN